MAKFALFGALFLVGCGVTPTNTPDLSNEDSGTPATSETSESPVEQDASVPTHTSKPTKPAVKPTTTETDSGETEVTVTDVDAGDKTATEETETTEGTEVDAGVTGEEPTTVEGTDETTVEEPTTTEETETTEVDAGDETEVTTVEVDAGQEPTTEETTTDDVTTVETTDETTVEVDAGTEVAPVCTPDEACADDGNPCTDDVCSADGSECEHPAKTNGTSCDSDSNVCTADICTAGECVQTPAPANTVCSAASCEDGVLTNAGVCGGQTTCQPATESDCFGVCNATGTACEHPVERLYAETDAPVWIDPGNADHSKTTSLVSVSSNANSVFVAKTNVDTTLNPPSPPVQVRTSSILKITKDTNDVDTIFTGNQVGALLATDQAVYFVSTDGVNSTINCVPADGGSPQLLAYGKTSMFVTNGDSVFWVDIDQTSGYSYTVLTTDVTNCSAPSAVTTVVTEPSIRTIMPTLVATADYLYYVFQDKASQLDVLVQLDSTCDYCQSGSVNRNPNNSLFEGSGGIVQDAGKLYFFAHPQTDNANANRVWTHNANDVLETVETGAEMAAYWENPTVHDGYVYQNDQRASLTNGQVETWLGDEHSITSMTSGLYFTSTYDGTLNVFKASL